MWQLLLLLPTNGVVPSKCAKYELKDLELIQEIPQGCADIKDFCTAGFSTVQDSLQQELEKERSLSSRGMAQGREVHDVCSG